MASPKEIVERAMLERGEPYSTIYRVFCNRLGMEARRMEPLEVLEALSQDLVTRIWLQPNKPLQERFSLSGREILCLVSPFRSIDHRAIEKVRETIADSRGRIESEFVIIVSADSGARGKIEDLTASYPETFAVFSYDDLRGLVTGGQDVCQSALEVRATSKDLYDIRQAVTSVTQFFGRRDLLVEMKRRLAAQGETLGVFGLRKVGKTSFLYQLLSRLRNDADVIAAHVDVQLIDAVNPGQDYFLSTLGRAIADGMPKRIQERHKFRTFRRAAEEQSRERLAEDFVRDVGVLLDEAQQRLVIVVDEVDLLYPEGNGSPWAEHFVPLWRLLRGLAQQYRGRVCFFLTGASPLLIEASQVGGRDNPLHQWIQPRYLGPFGAEDARDMLTKIGLRVRLDIASEAADFIVERTGGHPLLTRMYGSAIYQSLREREGSRAVGIQEARAVLGDVRRRAAPTINQILETMRERHPDDYFMLKHMADAKYEEFTTLADAFPESIEHLRGFGLVKGSEPRAMRSAISLVEDWMRGRSSVRAAPGVRAVIEPDLTGSEVEGYKLESRLGEPGGFATVYRATRVGSGREYAIKVYESVTLKQVQRETDCVGNMEHRNIVKVYGTGALPDGRPFLVMEYLSGRPLSEFVNPAEVLSEGEVVQVARDVLAALSALHPNTELAESLSKKDELTPEEGAALMRARQGYIHRDVKPANLMRVPDRGTVIVDFNIASPAGSAVVTVSGTPGYGLPGGAAVWCPEIDLHALGLTLAEVATGVRVEADRPNAIGDLMSAVTRKVRPEIAEFIQRLCGQGGRDRVHTCAEGVLLLGRVGGGRDE